MKQYIASVFALCLIAHPGLSQEDDGSSLMERGAQEFLEGLLLEIEPAWRELQNFMDEMGPAMIDLMDQVKDWSAYEPPEILENGDIIIRRKPEVIDPPEFPELEPAPQIEL